ncbi:unnamed protein product [Owenia fusiformis]|uniref:J domain-containing protein n=1 Tax=Owenia fusiformis TaxID=6347 RepID=A0A8S4PD57_OWEFU|nr:unnamed protein product [Owenia fusiformis]
MLREAGLLKPCYRCCYIQFKQSTRNYGASKTHYEILEVKRDAHPKEIRKAFVNLSKKVHPDLNPNDPHTHKKFVRLMDAYTVLSKPSTRRDYDLSLVSRINREHTARTMYSQHTPGASPYAGTGSPDPSEEAKKYWDETLFHMRDKSQDARYAGQPYYGVKGMKKMSNHLVVWGCVGVIILGCFIHLGAVAWSKTIQQKVLDERDRKHLATYNLVRSSAMEHGNAVQLQRFAARHGASPPKSS